MEMTFDSLDVIEVPVTIAGKKYVLKEATESSATRYRDAQLKGMRIAETMDGNKTSVVERMAETESLLVSLCLHEITETGFKTVPLEIIKTWPHRIVQPLFEKSEEISNLKPKETKEDLQKRIKELQGKLAKLNQNKDEYVGETEGKNS